MSENTDKRNKDVAGIDVVVSVLESGHSVELPATGYSMFPTLRPGDRVVVKPLLKGEVPGKGSVVVFIDDGATAQGWNGITAQSSGHRAQGKEPTSIMVMHRLIEIISDDSGQTLFITRGDSGTDPDKPWPQQQLIGVAVSFKRRKQEHFVNICIPTAWRYKYNRRLLWVFSRIERLTMAGS
jgi:signal peptidase I